MERSGACLCGTVTYQAELGDSAGACHCGMCRRWCSGPLMTVRAQEVTWTGEEAIGRYASSTWAERAFCKECGSSLFYRITAEGPYQGMLHLAVGTLDDPSGLSLDREVFIDQKPDLYAFAGERETMTEAQVMALFGGSSD